jgi:hypothetical protein
MTLSFLLLVPITSFAQPTIQGVLSGSLGPGTYIVNGDCEVASGQSLTINPGTTFLHNGHHTWYIYGELSAVGTEGQPIVFDRQDPIETHKWGGLRFQDGASEDCILQWCEIAFCKNQAVPNTRGGGIYIDRTGVDILNCTIRNCQAADGGGIYTLYANGLLISECTITNNVAQDAGGIYLSRSNPATVQNCVIAYNNSADN